MLSTINCDSEGPELTDHNEDEARQDASSQPEVVSLLDRLRSPTPSDLARKRKVQSNPPVGMKRSNKGSNSVFVPKSITPYDRVGASNCERWKTVLFCLQRAAIGQVTSPQASHKIC